MAIWKRMGGGGGSFFFANLERFFSFFNISPFCWAFLHFGVGWVGSKKYIANYSSLTPLILEIHIKQIFQLLALSRGGWAGGWGVWESNIKAKFSQLELGLVELGYIITTPS